MSDREDTLYAKPQRLVDFEFDARVAAVFPDMIRRSVPGYGNIIAGLGLFAERYALPGSRCYDLGCSLGAATLSMMRRLTPDVEVVAVDNAPAMVARCREAIAAEESLVPVEVMEADINDVVIEEASMVVLNFTLQFIAPARRLPLLKRIAEGLRPGGILVLSEKIRFDDPEEQALQEAMQIGFKRANGYSELEISQKRTALEKVLRPDTLEQHAERLREAGFTRSHVWFRQFNFASLVAFR